MLNIKIQNGYKMLVNIVINQVNTLENLCAATFAKYVFSAHNDTECLPNLKVISLPIILSQQIFDFCIGEAVADEINKILDFFLKNSSYTRLEKICLRNARQADVSLIYDLVKANLETLTYLDIRGCPMLPTKFWLLLPQAAKLSTLKTTDLQTSLKCPKMKVLVVDWKPKSIIQKIQQHIQPLYFDNLFENVLENLVYLDISWCPWSKRLRTLGKAIRLETLILRNCDISSLVVDITQLKNLRTLDISIGLEQEITQDFYGKYSDPDNILVQLLTSLPKLECLDISGTNLIPSVESSSSLQSALELRRNSPLQFLGVYLPTSSAITTLSNLPAITVAGNDTSDAIVEAIKRNVGMPKTLRNQLCKLRSIEGYSVDVHFLLDIQIKMLKSLRANEHFKLWGLKCLHTFLEQTNMQSDQINLEVRKELFLVLNRLIIPFNQEFDKVSELSLKFTLQIFIKLLPVTEIRDEGTKKEVLRLGNFLLKLNRTNLVYFKTEAMIFRLLHRLSQEPCICSYLCENNAILNCFEFFKYIQVYLGFTLRVPQTSEIVTLTWISILSFMKASQRGIHDFVRHRGLSWMYAHLSWFSYDERTRRDLRRIFIDVLDLLEASVSLNEATAFNTENVLSRSSHDLVYKVKDMIRDNK